MFRFPPILALSAMLLSLSALAAGKKPVAGPEAAGEKRADTNAVDISEVSDSQGDIFTTMKGEPCLVLGRKTEALLRKSPGLPCRSSPPST